MGGDDQNVFDSWLGGIGVSTQTLDAQSGEKAAELDAGQSTRPTIVVTANGDGSFTITGSDFLKNTQVHLRMVDEALHELFENTNSDGSGNISFQTGVICQGAVRISFSANDGRQVPHSQDMTDALWSNTITLGCPAPPPPDDPDDPDPSDPSPGGSPDPGDSSDS
jgi:hypothetical protein